MEVIASRLTNQIVISNVGNTNRELYSVKKHKLTLYGVNMSLVTPLAFGLAKAIPQRKVIALDGDGSLLMGLKTLATVATHPAKNLLVLVLTSAVMPRVDGIRSPPDGASIWRESLPLPDRKCESGKRARGSLKARDEILAGDELAFLKANVEWVRFPKPLSRFLSTA